MILENFASSLWQCFKEREAFWLKPDSINLEI